MKRILVFGDSNTHGFNPAGGRYDRDVRYPGILQTLLGSDALIIEEGLNGRTTLMDDPLEGGYKSGLKYLIPCLQSHVPLDVVTVMLGTNDTKARFNLNAQMIAKSLETMISTAAPYAVDANGKPSKWLIIAPAPILEKLEGTPFEFNFGHQSPAVSALLAPEYEKVAKNLGAAFLDAGKIAQVSPIDAVHLTEAGHKALAEAVYGCLMQLLQA